MKKYKGYYIDHVSFNSEEEIDDFLKQKAIEYYKITCQVFAIQKTVEASLYMDEQAQKLNKKYGISWEELEEMTIEAYKTA